MSIPYSITDWSWGDGVEVDARGLRHAHGALLNKLGTTDNLASRGGVVDSAASALAVTPSSGMVLAVTKGEVVVPSSTALDGAYIGYVPSGATFTLTAANPSLPRYDRVVVTVTDLGTSGSTMLVTVVDGTPASSPVIPAEPTNSTTLAVVYVGAGVTSISAGNITDYRKYTCAAGGILPVASSTDFPAAGSNYGYFHDIALSNLWTRIGSTNYPYRGTHRCTSSTRPTNKLEGTLIYETDTETILVWDGADWIVVCDVAPKTYTPSWTSSGTAPAIGNGTLVGNYHRQGKMIDVQIKQTWGSTTTNGTGTWYWSLPAISPDTDFMPQIGTGYMKDNDGGARLIFPYYLAGPKISAFYQDATPVLVQVTNALPVAVPAVGDVYSFRLRYEMA